MLADGILKDMKELGEPAKYGDIVNHFEMYSQEQVDEAIVYLETMGEIFEPEVGKFAVVEK